MKIYLCPVQQTEEKSHTWVSNIATFNVIVEDSEATSIICDYFLLSFKYEELKEAIQRIVSKMRLQSELVLIHPDINILSQRLQRDDINTEMLNSILFKCGTIKSVFSISTIEDLLPSNLQITHKHFDTATSNIVVKARRVK